MANAVDRGGAAQSADSGIVGNPDHAAALNQLLEQAEYDNRPEPSDVSEAGDETSGLSDLDDDNEPLDPQDASSRARNGGNNDGAKDEDEEEEEEEAAVEDGDEDEDEEPDTEAETERLEISPEKLKRAAIAGNIADKFDVPSEAQDSDDDDDGDDEEEDEEAEEERQIASANATRLPHVVAPESDGDSSLTEAEEQQPLNETLQGAGSKRKAGSSSYLNPDIDGVNGGPDRKRSMSTRGRMSLSDHLLKDRSAVAEANEQALLADSDEEEAVDDDEEKRDAAGTPALAEAPDALAAKAEEVDDDLEGSDRDLSDPPDDLDQAPDIGIVAEEAADEDADEDEDEDEDEDNAAAKTADELAKRKAALDSLMPIENLFAIFRDKLYDEKLAAVEAELEALTRPHPIHPEYLAMLQAVDRRRDEKIRIEQTALGYKIRALETKTVADRATLHGQYFQTVRAVREHAMEVMNEQSSRIQRERRQWRVKEPQYFIKFAPKRSQQIAQQTAYNKEVSLLSGIARHVGFPSAPEICGATAKDIENDLRAMKIQPQPQQYIAQMRSSVRADEALAEKQFMEKHAWANPGHPAHRQAALATPASQKHVVDLNQGPGQSGSTIEATPNPPSSLGPPPPPQQPPMMMMMTTAAATTTATKDPGSSPFDSMKQRLLSTRPSPAPVRQQGQQQQPNGLQGPPADNNSNYSNNINNNDNHTNTNTNRWEAQRPAFASPSPAPPSVPAPMLPPHEKANPSDSYASATAAAPDNFGAPGPEFVGEQHQQQQQQQQQHQQHQQRVPFGGPPEAAAVAADSR